MDISEALAGARLPEKTVPICLRGDLQAAIEDLEKQLDRALKDRGDSLAGGSRPRELAEQIEALRSEMEAHTVTFRMRALPRYSRNPDTITWTKLIAAHPPREGNSTDRTMGFNEDSFTGALIQACTYEPEITGERWEQLFERLTEFQFQKLFNTGWALNARDVDVPFSLAASTTLRISEPE